MKINEKPINIRLNGISRYDWHSLKFVSYCGVARRTMTGKTEAVIVIIDSDSENGRNIVLAF